MVPVSVCLAADLKESFEWGRHIAQAARESGKAWEWLPEFAGAAGPEMGGRHLAMILGAILESGHRFSATVHAYGPSSGSGNYVISLAAEA